MVVDQGVLQHACLETQVPDMLPHPSLATLLIMPERKQGEKPFHTAAGWMKWLGFFMKCRFLAFELILVDSYSGLFLFKKQKNSSDFLLMSFLTSAGCQERRLKGILSVSYRGDVWGGKAQAKESNKPTGPPCSLAQWHRDSGRSGSPGYRGNQTVLGKVMKPIVQDMWALGKTVKVMWRQ